MAETHPDEEAIFEVARNIESADARQAYLRQMCGEDLALEQRVQALLRAYEESASFLESPPPELGTAPTIDQPITEKPGTQIGPYKLLQQVGAGGMGVVYMAEQKDPVKRRVALKIIKPGMDTRQVIARFEAERQALAMMDHPNIAKVLDAGQTDTGRPYFVMELVKGVPVTQYCDEQHLTPKERLELFVPICQAVQHAHQKGIIHRDIKPSNVLVALFDGRPVPKVIDFGVAKATTQSLTEKTMFTQLGQVVGTLEYMSPEQAQVNQLDVDTRSDIYSLGVLLYELLTGDTPFDRTRLRSAAFDEMLRIIREEEPPKPSTKLSSSETLPSIAANRHVDPQRLTTQIRGELDWIVMKALEKDRGRRYETASKFAEDVQHFLNDEAVTACPPSAAYRFRKFARRNKAALATIGIVIAALLVGIAGITWHSIRVAMERDRAFLAETNADREADRARRSAAAAKTAAEREKQAAQRERDARVVAEENLYLANLHMIQQAYESANSPRVLELLNAHLPAGDAEAVSNHRDFAWYYWWWRTHRFTDALQVNGAGDVSPDGKLIAAYEYAGDGENRNHSRISIWDAAGGGPTKTFEIRDEGSGTLGRFTFSRDGRILGCVVPVIKWNDNDRPEDSGRVRIYLFDTSKLVRLAMIDVPSASIIGGFGRSTVVKYDRGRINSLLSFSHDNRLVTFVPNWPRDQPQEIPIWEVAGGKLHSVIRPQGERLTTTSKSGIVDGMVGVAFSPSEQLLVTCGNEQGIGVVHLWRPETGEKVNTFRGDVGTHNRGPCFSADGQRLITSALVPSTINSAELEWQHTVWSVANGRPLQQLNGDIDAVTPDFALAAVVSRGSGDFGVNGSIELRDVLTNKKIGTLMGHEGRVDHVQFVAGGKTLVSFGGDAVRSWDLSTDQLMLDHSLLRDIDDSGFNTTSFSPDGGELACIASTPSSVENGRARVALYDAASGQRRAHMDFDYVNGVGAIAYSPDEQLLATSGRDPNTGRYRIDLRDRATDKSRTLGEHLNPVVSLEFSPNAKWLASADSHGPVLKVWNLETREVQFTNRVPERPVAVGVGVRGDVAFSADSSLLAACVKSDGRWVTELWHVTTGDRRQQWPSSMDAAVSISPVNGQVAFSDRDGDDHVIRIADPSTGQIRRTIRGVSEYITGLTHSPDGKTLVSSDADHLIFWDVRRLVPKLTLPGGSRSLRFSPDGKVLAAGGRLYRMATSEEIKAGRVRQRPVNAFEIAETHRRRRQWDQAIDQYTQALAQNAEDVWALWGRADCYVGANSLDLALADFKVATELVEKNGGDVPPARKLSELRKAALRSGNLDLNVEASRLLVQWHKLVRERRQAKENLDAPAVLQARRSMQAHIVGNRNLKYAQSCAALGQALLKTGDKERLGEAVHYFRTAIEVRGDGGGPYINLGLALLRMGKEDEALLAFRRATEHLSGVYRKNSGNEQTRRNAIAAFKNLANLLIKQDKKDEAINVLRQATALDLKDGSILDQLERLQSSDPNPSNDDGKTDDARKDKDDR